MNEEEVGIWFNQFKDIIISKRIAFNEENQYYGGELYWSLLNFSHEHWEDDEHCKTTHLRIRWTHNSPHPLWIEFQEEGYGCYRDIEAYMFSNPQLIQIIEQFKQGVDVNRKMSQIGMTNSQTSTEVVA